MASVVNIAVLRDLRTDRLRLHPGRLAAVATANDGLAMRDGRARMRRFLRLRVVGGISAAAVGCERIEAVYSKTC